MNGRKYGSQNTNLILTTKADKFYSETDPLNIFEHEDGTYTVTGLFNGTFENAKTLNDELEAYADAIAENE
jgi:hypothetical protein